LKTLIHYIFVTISDLEKNNDDARSVVRNQCNGQNQAACILLHEHLERVLSDCERQKRVYTKRSSQYWDGGIVERGNKRARSLDFTKGNTNTVDILGKFKYSLRWTGNIYLSLKESHRKKIIAAFLYMSMS